jgi:GNAT superfamily N-acetyltransferase
LTEVDGCNHVALVATAPDPTGQPHGLGVARFIRSATDPSRAEPAITVSDAHQGRGVGALLARALGRAARDRGVTHFRGPILTDNVQVRRLLEGFGAELRKDRDDDLVFEIALAENDEREDEAARSAGGDAARPGDRRPSFYQH